nr:MAG TPA: hypothetical protein [Bacteriophage sp.]
MTRHLRSLKLRLSVYLFFVASPYSLPADITYSP